MHTGRVCEGSAVASRRNSVFVHFSLPGLSARLAANGMKNLTGPLTDDELEQLSDFLLNRVSDEHDEDPDFDCGIIDISELDGFLTALVSGPNVVPPSAWLPTLWGEEEPVWDSMDDFQRIFALLTRRMNSVATLLSESRDEFEPIFYQRRVKDETHLIVDEWCFGYMSAVALDSQAWRLSDPAISDMLAPIKLYGTEVGWEELRALEQTRASRMRDAIPQAARDVYGYWLAQRAPKSEPQRRASPKVGRNDPCPCGSGRKYKQCCLQ
jgi:uncharacterized protein